MFVGTCTRCQGIEKRGIFTWSKSPRLAVSCHSRRRERATAPLKALAQISETSGLSGSIVAGDDDKRRRGFRGFVATEAKGKLVEGVMEMTEA